MVITEDFSTLLMHAQQMLLDRRREEADLIYYVCKMDPDMRAAIILGYQMLFNEDKDES